MGGKGSGSTSTQAQLPPELSQLFEGTAYQIGKFQNQNPLGAFLGAGPAARGNYGHSGGQGARTVSYDYAPYQTADRAGQFGEAQQGIGRAQNIAGTALGSRAGLNAAPPNTTAGINTAGGAVGQAAREFGNVRSDANVRIGDLINQSDQRVTGANIQQDPGYQAAIQAYQDAILPQVQNSAAQSGLGRSTGLQQSIAASQAQYLMPTIQDYFGREERAIDRGLGARQYGISTNADLGLREAGANQDALRFLSGTQQAAGNQELQRTLEALGADERSRGLQYDQAQQSIGQLLGLGESQQGYEQGRLDRTTADFLREQGLAEQALYQPFGAFVPTTIGQSSTSTGKKGK